MDLRLLLNQFISRKEGFSWAWSGSERLSIVSGIWKTGPWRHDVVIVDPKHPSDGSTVLLYSTGGNVNATDLEEARTVAERSGVSVAMLFHIPNQPLFEMSEDDLIAHTFEQYIDSGDATWPLLYPMARAVIRCMDAVQEERPCARKFVLTGASKRGWTTWLAAASGDPRIAGIAPMVIDNLNFPAQMAHQLDSWGTYSEQIEDYTSRDLPEEIGTARGSELVVMMDPINYVDRIQCPLLIINGANDHYWTVDALSLYWHMLPEDKRCLIVPNAGHLLGDKRAMIEGVSAFTYACAKGLTLPTVTLSEDRESVEAPGADEIRWWGAKSETLDFRDSLWEIVPGPQHSTSARNWAYMAEARFTGPTGGYSLTTPITVSRSGH